MFYIRTRGENYKISPLVRLWHIIEFGGLEVLLRLYIYRVIQSVKTSYTSIKKIKFIEEWKPQPRNPIKKGLHRSLIEAKIKIIELVEYMMFLMGPFEGKNMEIIQYLKTD